jgi:PAS domain S-box-containing protein
VIVALAFTLAPAVHALVLALRRTTRDLSEAEERFRKAFDDNQVGMALVSREGRFQRVNRALCEITGYPSNELAGKAFSEITHPDDLDADLDALRDLIDGERYGYRTEKRYIHAEGHPVWISLNVSPVYDRDGDLSYLISQIEDITEEGVRGAAHPAGAPRLAHRTSEPDASRTGFRIASARRTPAASRSSIWTSTVSSSSTTRSATPPAIRCS